jgi:hypothetical protein
MGGLTCDLAEQNRKRKSGAKKTGTGGVSGGSYFLPWSVVWMVTTLGSG